MLSDHDIELIRHAAHGDPFRVLGAHADYWPPQEYPGGAVEFIAPQALPEIVEILLRRGCSDAQVQGLLGGNFLRVAQQVWR